MSKLYKKIDLEEFGDKRGKLVVIEELKGIPFDIKRVFYIYGSDNSVVRGKHANRKSEFFLINIVGSSKVMITDGIEKEIVELNKPWSGVFLPKMVWKEMYDFSADSVLLVLSSECYDDSEYIRSYENFLIEKNIK